jgi:hypothetical protein
MKVIIKLLSVTIVFIIGYIAGNIGIDSLLNKIKSEAASTSISSGISLLSSVITIIVFVAYILGKLYAIKKTEFTLNETIEVSYSGDLEGFKVVEEVELGDVTDETIYFMSSEPMREISFYAYDFEDDKKGKLIYNYQTLKNDEALKIKTYLPCGIPNYIIEYVRFDYVEGKITLGEDGRNGVISNNLSIKHTWKSYFYYLVKA